jgi:CelD/BcsL family acetyltransferase involved in cellulose biosynthesis
VDLFIHKSIRVVYFVLAGWVHRLLSKVRIVSSIELADAARPKKVLPSPTTARRSRLALEVIGPSAAENLWRSFQDEAICSPYQRYEWVQSFAAALAVQDGFEVRVLALRDDAGRPLMLLPLALSRQHGVMVASFVGGKQANFNLPITAPGSSSVIRRPELRRLLVNAGKALGADAFLFLNQPLSWRGEPNPLAAFGGSPSANEGFKLSLGPKPDETLARAFSGESRKKMRKKTRHLAEFGEVKFSMAGTAAEVETILQSFLDQKQRRFRELGIENPFDDAMQDFIRRGALAGLDRGDPAIELYALSAGERIVATFGGTGDRWRLCGMFNSFDNSEDVIRSSPGELLLAELIRRQCERGREVFDLGVGEARYKTALCDEIEQLIDVFVPVTARGRLYARAVWSLVAAKRYVKQRPWAWRTVNLLRTLKATALS